MSHGLVTHDVTHHVWLHSASLHQAMRSTGFDCCYKAGRFAVIGSFFQSCDWRVLVLDVGELFPRRSVIARPFGCRGQTHVHASHETAREAFQKFANMRICKPDDLSERWSANRKIVGLTPIWSIRSFPFFRVCLYLSLKTSPSAVTFVWPCFKQCMTLSVCLTARAKRHACYMIRVQRDLCGTWHSEQPTCTLDCRYE